jgi:S-adenosylmethionine/arginine decarboxylase-like enzyme
VGCSSCVLTIIFQFIFQYHASYILEKFSDFWYNENMLFHKHMLINAKVSNPIKTESEAIEFLENLVRRIDMKIIKGPFASYVDAPGNRGLTAIVMIETSHIAFHIWDEVDPGMLQFDLYTCGSLDKFDVLNTLNDRFDIKSIEWVLFDRENGFVIEDSNKLGK